MSENGKPHALVIGVRDMIVHGMITLLAVSIAFSLPYLARFILFEWWPMVEADSNLLLVLEVAVASTLVLVFNLGKIGWDNRHKVALARMASIVYARDMARGWMSRWRERLLLNRLPAVRDAFVVTVTGHDTFVDERNPLRTALEDAYELRVMLVDPAGEGMRRRAGSLPPDTTLLTLQAETEASIAFLAGLRRRGKKVSLKFYEQLPFWKVVVLGDHAWVQHCHAGVAVREQPEYVFSLQHRNPRLGLFVPFYVYVLERWNEDNHPEYDFGTGELVYRDAAGNERARRPLGIAHEGAPAMELELAAAAG